MTPQSLKSAILQLAIQGKLVPQRPEDGVARVPAALNTEKRKAQRHGEEMEPPFDIPESWRWVRLGDCTTYAARKEKVSPSEILPDTWSLDLEDIEKDTGKIINYCSASNRSITGEKVVFRKGQILYSKLRPYLKKILVAPQDGICSPELVPFSAFDGIDANYLVAVLRSPHVDFAINSVTYGVKMPRVGTETMVNLPIPLPALPEQHRIVAKIEELLPLIDRYEQAWTKLADFTRRFPADMQKSLLQLAIQGQLVDQRPEEGTGEQLYRKILATKSTKKDKKLPPIADDEIPFEIPASWKWVRVSEVCNVSDGTHQTPKYVEKGKPFISAQNVKPYHFLPDIHRKVSEEDFWEYNKKVAPAKGDILMTRVGAGIGEAAIIDQDLEFSIYVSLALIKGYSKDLDMNYLLHVINSPLGKQLAKKKTLGKGASQGNLNLVFIREFVFPLPPLAEQKRIVAKLEELLPLCERLK